MIDDISKHSRLGEDRKPDSMASARGAVLGLFWGSLIWLGVAALVACWISLL
jgi:hypothetical protein